MNLNKCERCGCFFASNNEVCPNCLSKDETDIAKLKNFLSETEDSISIEDLSLNTGISINNVNRFLKNDTIKSNLSGLDRISNGIISIGL